MGKFRLGEPLAMAGILLLSTEGGRKLLKNVTKQAARVGVALYDKVKEISAEVREEATQLIEEAKAERNNGKGAAATTLRASEEK